MSPALCVEGVVTVACGVGERTVWTIGCSSSFLSFSNKVWGEIGKGLKEEGRKSDPLGLDSSRGLEGQLSHGL